MYITCPKCKVIQPHHLVHCPQCDSVLVDADPCIVCRNILPRWDLVDGKCSKCRGGEAK